MLKGLGRSEEIAEAKNDVNEEDNECEVELSVCVY